MALHTKEIVFLNAQDPYAMQLLPQIRVDTIKYQTQTHPQEKAEEREIRFGEHQFVLGAKNHEISSHFSLFLKKKQIPISTNLFGQTNYGYLAVALAIVDILASKEGKPELPAEKALTLNYQLQAGRMSLFAGKHKTLILDSTYNASPRSMREVIDTAIQLRSQLFSPAEIRLILGDMRELGELTEQEHRRLAGYVSQSADQVFLLGEAMGSFLGDELEKI